MKKLYLMSIVALCTGSYIYSDSFSYNQKFQNDTNHNVTIEYKVDSSRTILSGESIPVPYPITIAPGDTCVFSFMIYSGQNGSIEISDIFISIEDVNANRSIQDFNNDANSWDKTSKTKKSKKTNSQLYDPFTLATKTIHIEYDENTGHEYVWTDPNFTR